MLFLANGYDGHQLKGSVEPVNVPAKLAELKAEPKILRIMIWEAGSDQVAEDWYYAIEGEWKRF